MYRIRNRILSRVSTFLYELGRRCFVHWGRVMLAWVLVIVLAGVSALALGQGTRNNFELPGSEAYDSFSGLSRAFPGLAAVSALVVVVAPDGTSITDERSQQLVEQTVEDLKAVDGVAEVGSPYDELVRDTQVSSDDSAVQLQVEMEDEFQDITQEVKDDVQAQGKALEDAGYTVSFGGDLYGSTGPALSVIELLGLAVALIVLYRMFRSWRAAFLPIVTAVIGVVATIEIIWAITGFIDVSATAPLLALMIGLAVGIDYALFIVSRHRELLSQDVPADESAARAVATAGSAVVFAGITVMIALGGLAVAGIPFLTVMGAAGALSVAVAVAVALTLLPAFLGLLGQRLHAKEGERPPGAFSRRWVKVTTRFPTVAMVVVVGGLAVATLPVQDLQLALPDAGDENPKKMQRITYDLIDEHFGPGYNGPLLVTMDVITSRDPVGVVDAVEKDLRAMPDVESIGLATPNASADTAVIQVIPSSGPSDLSTRALVERIRDAEPGWEDEFNVDVSVTGNTAVGIDVSKRLQDALLPFGVLVLGLSVVLLLVVFRSILVPIKATLGFVLSTGAAFGAVVAVFQWGWLGSAVHLDQPGPLISFLPILLMSVLFGLSMDYEVFLMSRMKEEFVRTGDADRAIVDGFVGSSRVVTAAAVIMLAVFAAFVPEGDVTIKAIAFALAVGVFVDAFLVRMLFAPAVMKYAGAKAWALPAFLDRRLPHIDIEGEALHRRIDLESWPRPGSTSAVSAAGLTLVTDEGVVYNDVNVEVPEHHWLVVHGPSGSGKTALLLTIAGRMDFTEGRLRVDGHLLPQESTAVRRGVALAETRGVNDLDDNLTVDQHIAERLSIGSFGLWVSTARIAPVRDELNRALSTARTQAGLPAVSVEGDTHVADLAPLERMVFGIVLALMGEPRVLVLDDADILRGADEITLLWSVLRLLLEGRDTALVAAVQSRRHAPRRSPRVVRLALETRRTLDELRI